MIKAIVFDFGGVLIRTQDYTARRQWEMRLGLPEGGLAAAVFASEAGALAELGRISNAERWRRVGETLGLNSPNEVAQLQRDFFSGDAVNQELISLIHRLRGRYKTALLSNAPMELAQELANFGLNACFDEVVISAVVGLAKPDPAIYRLMLARLGVAAAEAVFIDDMQVNVDAATALGIVGIHYRDNATLYRDLSRVLGEWDK
ncbi:MAG: HAD family phosphatase [Chloroflexi bacterium]|nr:HAD family phosphatase [Chloroflexota bacterium]